MSEVIVAVSLYTFVHRARHCFRVDVRNHRVAARRALQSQFAEQSLTPGHARERFSHFPEDRTEVVTDGAIEEAVTTTVNAIRRHLI